MKRACIALLLVGGCIRIETVVTAESASDPTIVFDAPIPDAPETLPIYSLTTPPIEQPLLLKLGRNAELCRSNEPGDGAPQDKSPRARQLEPEGSDSVHCRTDKATGEIEIYPNFRQILAPRIGGRMDRKRGLEITQEVVAEEKKIAKEPTLNTLVHMQYVLKHERAERRSPDEPAPAPKQPDANNETMLFTVMKRQVKGLDVDGPGSRMIVASDDSGVQGYVRSWRTAAEPREVKSSRTPVQLRAEIERQLLALKSESTLHVRKIQLSYYDGNDQLLQPVYRFVVEANGTRNSLGDPEHFVGYVRYADTEEKVPELGVMSELKAPSQTATAKRAAPNEPPFRLGAYIARDPNPDWQNDARDFVSQIQLSATADNYTIKQFLPASPALFTTDRRNYVNSVDVALVEAHGAPWAIATLGDCCEPVQLADPFGRPGSMGFGPGADQGRLQHLVLHSCNVVASPDETPRWAEPWWDVFNGLRTVVGYRTAMYIDDGAGAAFGRSLGAGSAVLPAWFNAVASLNAYARDPSLSFRCAGEHAMGRPAAIAVCGEEDATTFSISRATDPAKCLDAWWIADAVENNFQ